MTQQVEITLKTTLWMDTDTDYRMGPNATGLETDIEHYLRGELTDDPLIDEFDLDATIDNVMGSPTGDDA